MAVSQHTNCGLLIEFEQSCFKKRGTMGELCRARAVRIQFETKERNQYLNDFLH